MSQITAPIYNTKTGLIEHVSPGIVRARLLYNNAGLTKFNQTNRGLVGIYLPAEQAPAAKVVAPIVNEEDSEEQPVKKTRTRRPAQKK